jgi:hypothetical protein
MTEDSPNAPNASTTSEWRTPHPLRSDGDGARHRASGQREVSVVGEFGIAADVAQNAAAGVIRSFYVK